MTPPARLLSLLLIPLAACSVGASVARAAPRDLLAASSDEAVFVARVEKMDLKAQPDAPPERTIVLMRHLYGGAHWKQLITLSRRIVSLAARGEDAVAVLDNGDWVTLWDGGSPLGPPPEGGRLLAMAADRSNDQSVLWGIVMPPAPTTQPATTSAASTLPAPVSHVPGIYRFESNRWSRVADLPVESITPDASAISLTVVGHQPVLTVQTAADHLRSWNWEAPKWSARRDTAASAAIKDFRVIEAGLPDTLWYTTGGPGHVVGGVGNADESLAADGAAAGDPRSATLAAETLRVYCASGSDLYEQAYNRDGTAMGKRVSIAANALSQESPVENWVATTLTVVFTLLLFGAARRRVPVTPTALEAAGVSLAPLGPRFAAGVIDALPVLLALAYIAYRMPPGQTFDEVSSRQEMWQDGMPFYLMAILYVVYTSIAELLSRQTLGKWLFGLRVVGVDGLRPGAWAVLVRNLLRIVDVMMMCIPLALVFFSPLHQRIGDVAAGTLVVRARPEAPE